MGIKRKDTAALMAVTRESSARDLAGKMKADATWKDRSAAYPIMLKVCIGSLPKMQ